MTNKCFGILYRWPEPRLGEDSTLTEMAPTNGKEVEIRLPRAPRVEPSACVQVAIMSRANLEKFQLDQPSCTDLLEGQPSASDLLDHQPDLAELLKNQPTPADLLHDIELHEQ